MKEPWRKYLGAGSTAGSPSLQGIAYLSGIWKVGTGVKWQFGKKQCCELDLKADDIFCNRQDFI